jgi:hypothetical protein
VCVIPIEKEGHMSSENEKPSLLRKSFVFIVLLGILPLAVPTFFGLWLPDLVRGEMLEIDETDTLNRVKHFRLTQRLEGLNGYIRHFSYTLDDKHWFSMTVGAGEPKLWNPRMEHSSGYKSLKIFDRNDEIIRIEWSSQSDRYVWVKSDGSVIKSTLIPIPAPLHH